MQIRILISVQEWKLPYRKGILKNRTYKVVDGDGLAADHAAIILEGYHHVKEALNA